MSKRKLIGHGILRPIKSLPIEGWQHVCVRLQDGNRSETAAVQGCTVLIGLQTPMNLDSSSHYVDV